MFDIEVIGRPEGEGESLFNWGGITLGCFRDEFQAPPFDWVPADHAPHWLESAQRLVEGEPVAVFLTHMLRPEGDYFLGWPAWHEGDRVWMQERRFLREHLNGASDPA